jgi:hypothetical protein
MVPDAHYTSLAHDFSGRKQRLCHGILIFFFGAECGTFVLAVAFAQLFPAAWPGVTYQ